MKCFEQPGCPRQAGLIKITNPAEGRAPPSYLKGLQRGQLALTGEVWLSERTLGQESGRGCRAERLGKLQGLWGVSLVGEGKAWV